MSAAAVARRLWSGELGSAGKLLSAALLPAEALYRAGIVARNVAYTSGVLPTRRAALPVISVGNIAVGGSGKTPFASWLVQRLQQRGQRPALVHGGYASDEPELHRLWVPEVPVIVDRDRVRAAHTAREQGASVIVLDDAFQHRRLRRDLDIVLVSVERWTTAVRLLPRGPWREPARALRRAGLIACVRRTAGTVHAQEAARDMARVSGRDVLNVHLRADRWTRAGEPTAAPTAPAVLVAGIAEPDLFARNARAAGADIVRELIFPDHHDYTAADAQLVEAAAADHAIVTTAKDRVKLRRLLDDDRLHVLEQEVVIERGAELLDAALDRVLR